MLVQGTLCRSVPPLVELYLRGNTKNPNVMRYTLHVPASPLFLPQCCLCGYIKLLTNPIALSTRNKGHYRTHTHGIMPFQSCASSTEKRVTLIYINTTEINFAFHPWRFSPSSTPTFSDTTETNSVAIMLE